MPASPLSLSAFIALAFAPTFKSGQLWALGSALGVCVAFPFFPELVGIPSCQLVEPCAAQKKFM